MGFTCGTRRRTTSRQRRANPGLILAAGMVGLVVMSGCSSRSSQGSTGSAVSGTTIASSSNAAVGAGSASARGGKKLGFIIGEDMVSRWAFDRKGFEDEAKALGDIAVVQSAHSDAQKERTLVENMITQKVDALVITPVDINTAAQLFKMAKDAGIPTVDYNFVVPNSGANYVIARNAREFGQITARRALQEHPTGNYVLVSGDEANSVARDTLAGYLDVLKPEVSAGHIRIVSQQYNQNWDPQRAEQQVEQALVRVHNDLAAVLVANDGMALAVEQALKAQGLLGKTFVSGVDADLANVQAIARGEQSITIWTDFYAMGKAAAQAADAAARKKTLSIQGLQSANGETPATVMMPTIVVDKSNLCTWITQYHYYSVEQVFGSNVSACGA